MTAPFLGTNQVGSFPAAGIRPRQTKNVIFTTSGFWTVPPNVYTISITMAGGGGGGGGGGGYGYDGINSYSPAGGGGGGGAATVAILKNIDVVPNNIFLITVGAGGAGGAAGNSSLAGNGIIGTAGTSGGITRIDGYRYSFFVSGAAAGQGGAAPVLGSDAAGGFAGAAPTVINTSSSYAGIHQFIYIAGGAGGAGGPSDAAGATSGTPHGIAAPNFQYTQGGVRGTCPGVTAGNWRGGGGGGGGSNLFSRGGAGGGGGFVSTATSTNSTASVAGQSPSELFTGYKGYGAGGGGGGGGTAYVFHSGVGVQVGSAGGNGGSGFVEITWEE